MLDSCMPTDLPTHQMKPLKGLCRLLAEYREFAGRLIFYDNGRQCILLNDEGIRFVEATSGSPLGSLMDKPSPYYLDLHPHITGIEEELFQVQLTRFACGFAGRLIFYDNGRQCILLNDEGIRFIEATSSSPLGSLMDKPSPYYLDLHPHITGIEEELFQVQLTRFACGSLVVGCTIHHAVLDAQSLSRFFIAWGQTVRNGIPVLPLPLHDRSIFIPRNPPHFQFEHSEIEYTAHHRTAKDPELQHTIVMERAHFTSEFLAKLKSKVSSDNPCDKPYTTFECLTAHLWRKITRVRKLEEELTTTVRIPVNGRFRMRNPTVPMSYLGNVVLWAWPRSKVEGLLSKPVGHAARLIHDAVAGVDDDYFRSFIDFSSSKEKMEGLVPSAYGGDVVLSPDLEVSSWLRIPFYDMDFGTNPPHLFAPSYERVEGLLHILPSFTGIGDVDAFVSLFDKDMRSFIDGLYYLD